MKKIDYQRVHNSLRKYRKSRGLTQGEVSRILGLKSGGIVSRWEIGHYLPKTVNVLKMAVLYRTMADALFIDLRKELQKDILEAEEKVLKNRHYG